MEKRTSEENETRKKHAPQKTAGFTLIETLVAAAIFLVGVVSVTNLLTTGISSLRETQSRVIAASLAQEGAEIVRAMRDTNWIISTSYKSGISGLSNACVSYELTTPVNPCSDAALYINETTGRYSHTSSDTKTKYERRISVSEVTDSDSVAHLKVEAVVSWNGQSITVEDRLYDWK